MLVGFGGMHPRENFEKLDSKSCNLSELKVILVYSSIWPVHSHSQFLKFGFDFIEYVM
jgi:hypothetical protein